jgi:hypothetical protein
MLTGGFDFASAFYFRGYEQAGDGPVFQPYLNAFTAYPVGENLVVRPYVALFHSAHWGSDNHVLDMSDVMLGAIASANGFLVDARYGWYTMNPMRRSSVHELGGRVSYDLLAPGTGSEALQPFSLRPFAGLYAEISDQHGTEDTFVNVGLEPAWRGEVAGYALGVTLPVEWGLSADDYYLDADGSNDALGYFSSTLTTSLALPVRPDCGRWFLNTSLQYLHLAADSVRAQSGGDDEIWVGKVGLSFVY